MSALAVRLDLHRITREVLRHLRIIAAAMVVAIILHQWGSQLVSCFVRSPDPILCSPPEIILPDTRHEHPNPGQAQNKIPFTVVTSATTVTPLIPAQSTARVEARRIAANVAKLPDLMLHRT